MRASLPRTVAVAVDPFAERLARVRQRFVAALESKIEDTYSAIPDLSGDTPAAVEAVEETYRRMHNIVGICPTVGFVGTGRAARSIENLLMVPQEAERGLTVEEIDSFKKALHALRDIATRELQSFHAGWQ
jgi:chemotaxis protein histidine kinase CheA